MHCWILINIDLEYKDMNYFLRKPIFPVLQGLSDQKRWRYGNIAAFEFWYKDIFVSKIWYSKTKRIDYLLRQCDDLWVAFHQSESINWAVGEKIALVFFFNFMLQFVCQSYQRKMNIELQVQIQTKNSKINVKVYMYNKKVVFFPSQEFPTHSCPHGRWADPKSLTLEDVNNEESSYYYQRQ